MRHLDLTCWPENHPFYSYETTEAEKTHLLSYRKMNKKRLGTFSPETGDRDIAEIFLVKAKQYYIKLKDVKNDTFSAKIAAKGANRQLVDLKYVDYVKFLLGSKKFNLMYDAKTFVVRNHVLKLRYQRRKVTDKYDDKRFLLSCGIKSLSHGHPDIVIHKEVENIVDEMIESLE